MAKSKCPKCTIGNLFLIADDENGEYFECFSCGGHFAEPVPEEKQKGDKT